MHGGGETPSPAPRCRPWLRSRSALGRTTKSPRLARRRSDPPSTPPAAGSTCPPRPFRPTRSSCAGSLPRSRPRRLERRQARVEREIRPPVRAAAPRAPGPRELPCAVRTGVAGALGPIARPVRPDHAVALLPVLLRPGRATRPRDGRGRGFVPERPRGRDARQAAKGRPSERGPPLEPHASAGPGLAGCRADRAALCRALHPARSAFPASFRQDLDAYRQPRPRRHPGPRRAAPPLAGTNAQELPLRAAPVRQHARASGALRRRRSPRSPISSNPSTSRTVCAFCWRGMATGRSRAPSTLPSCSARSQSTGRRHPPRRSAASAAWRRTCARGRGLSTKNRRRLAPLRDERNLARLFLLPGKIRKDIKAKSEVTRADALLMQHAVALMILTYARSASAIWPRSTWSGTCAGRDRT